MRKEAVTLAAAGYDVFVVGTGEPPPDTLGLPVVALPRPSSRIVRMTRTAFQAWRAVRRLRPAVVHFHDPELVLVGLALRWSGAKVVYDMHEDAAKDVADKPYLPAWSKPLISRIVSLVEVLALRGFDGVVAATEAIGRRLPAGRATVVRNLPLARELVPTADVPIDRRPPHVAYIGGLASFNGVDTMIRAMAMLPPDVPIRLQLGGQFASAEDEAAARRLPGADRVDFLGWVARDRLPAIYGAVRAGLVVYRPTPNVVDSEPNKFFEVLSAGLPLVASDFPHWRAFIERHECGLTVPADDPLQLARAIEAVVHDPDRADAMGRRGRSVVINGLNWEVESTRLTALYARLAPLPPSGGS